MILSSYIHELLAAAHRRDLLEAADQNRLVAQARQRRRERRRFPLPFRWPAPRRGAIVEPRVSRFATAVRGVSTPGLHQPHGTFPPQSGAITCPANRPQRSRQHTRKTR